MGSEIIVVPAIFIGLPWLILHYVTKWKSAATLTGDDELLLSELHETARRFDDRLATIERIMTAENPAWRQLSADPASIGIDDHNLEKRRIGQ